MASMREWLKDPESRNQRVVVVHCKAGKGRSGTVACSYLISQEGWTLDDALMRFTARRMRSGFGNGVSIPSQLRWVGYVDWWAKHGKVYVERQIEVLEVHVWGLRDGVKVAVEGYVEEGKIIKTFHTFGRHERTVMDDTSGDQQIPTNLSEHINEKALPLHETKAQSTQTLNSKTEISSPSEPSVSAVIFRPAEKLILPTSDINIDFERRNKAAYGFTMVTSVAHVWFNAFFECQKSSTSSQDSTKPYSSDTNPLVNESLPDSGVFEIAWEGMDGIKGSARKGTRALDRLAVVWRAVPDPNQGRDNIIVEPTVGEPVPETKPADWTKAHQEDTSTLGKDLGLRTESPSSADVSRASSMLNGHGSHSKNTDPSSEIGTQSHIPDNEGDTSHSQHPNHPTISISEPASLNKSSPSGPGDGSAIDLGLEKVQSPNIVDGMKAASVQDLKTAEQHLPGQIVRDD